VPFTRRGALALATAAFAGLATRPASARTVTDVSGAEIEVASRMRIVSIGSDVTETVYALGEGKRVVAVDTTSMYPHEVHMLPNVGYMRALSTEGVLSMNPDLVVASAGSGPPEVMGALRQSGVPLALVDYTPSPRTVIGKIDFIADLLDVKERGAALAAAVQVEFDKVNAVVAKLTVHPRVLFVLSLAGGRIMAGGDESSAAEIIALAGALNAVSGFKGYKPVSEEAVIAAAPEAVVMMHSHANSVDAETLFSREPFASIPAAKAKRLVKMDGTYILGFGPRTPSAARELAQALHPDATL
jgi:iron complex transport system substrate-binding protein